MEESEEDLTGTIEIPDYVELLFTVLQIQNG